MTRTDAETTWRVRPVRDRTFVAGSARWAAVAPGCPAGPHPHRGCACEMFASPEDAARFVEGQTS